MLFTLRSLDAGNGQILLILLTRQHRTSDEQWQLVAFSPATKPEKRMAVGQACLWPPPPLGTRPILVSSVRPSIEFTGLEASQRCVLTGQLVTGQKLVTQPSLSPLGSHPVSCHCPGGALMCELCRVTWHAILLMEQPQQEDSTFSFFFFSFLFWFRLVQPVTRRPHAAPRGFECGPAQIRKLSENMEIFCPPPFILLISCC